jgi:AcrR family transcriptional regulator
MLETRQRIIDAALRLLAGSGYHEVSMEDLAKAAGVSRPTVYKHFDSKLALFRALQEDLALRGGLERVREARLHPDVLEALRGFLLENCRFFGRVGPVMRVARAAAWTDSEARQVAEATYFAGRRQSVTELVARLEAEHGLDPAWPAYRAVDAIMALSSFEAFDTLTTAQGRTSEESAAILFDLARGILASGSR